MTIAAFVALAIMAVAANIKLPVGYRVLVVQSGSMEPAIPVGSVVLTKPTADFAAPMPNARFLKGDVITYAIGRNNFVSHRVVDIQEKDGTFFYQTKGDANKAADQKLIPESEVVGRAMLTVPYLGRFVNFAKTPLGYFLMIVIPSLYVILSETWAIISEIRKSKPKVPSAGFALPIALIFVTAFYFTAGTAAYFSDTANSTNNVFTAAESFGPPIAETLVINEVLPDSSCSQGQTEAQWLEIYNGYSTTVNLKNFKITDGTNVIDLVSAASVNVPPGGFALLAHNSAIWGPTKCYQDNGATTANLGGNLDIDPVSKTLQLLDSGNVVIDTVKWGSATTGLGITQNQSIERDPDGKDTALGANFNASDFVVMPTPQPGL